jgi:hypothetical protein
MENIEIMGTTKMEDDPNYNHGDIFLYSGIYSE